MIQVFFGVLLIVVVSSQDDPLAAKIDELDIRSLHILSRVPRSEKFLKGHLRSEVFNFLLEFESARLQMLKREQIDPMLDYKMRRILARIQATFKAKYPAIKARLHRLVTRLFTPLLVPLAFLESPLTSDATPSPVDNSVTLPPYTPEVQWIPQTPEFASAQTQFVSNVPQWNNVPYNFFEAPLYYQNNMPSSQGMYDNSLLYYPYRYRYQYQ